MLRWTHVLRSLVLACLLFLFVGCDSGSFAATTPTVYDLTQRPADFANKEVTVLGVYIWKPGNPGISLLSSAAR